ncbi:MAG: hypothetical protein ACMG6E_03480 [Candidatus Roizmanbacteria bacterium]
MSSEDSSGEEWPACHTAEGAVAIFCETLFAFADSMVDLCQKEEVEHAERYLDKNKIKPSTKIILVRGLLELFTHQKLIQHYVNHVLPWKDKIESRNDVFFLENDHIYPNAPKADIEFFRNLWRKNSPFHLNNIEKESVYEYFDAMIHYCEVWKEMAGFTSIKDLVSVIKGRQEDEAYEYIMKTFTVDDFEDFGYGTFDEFMAKHSS